MLGRPCLHAHARRQALVPILLLVVIIADPTMAQAQSPPFAAVDACLQQEMQQKNLPGASMAIALDGALAHTSAFGVRQLGTQRYVDTDTIFRINSTTKMMGAAAVMQQVERGRLDLDAPITDYVPDLRFAEPWDASALTTLINGHANMQGTVDCALRELAGLEPQPQGGGAGGPATWGRYSGSYEIQDVYGARWMAHVELQGGRLRIHHPDWQLPARLDLEGRDCGRLDWSSAFDVDRPRIRAYGLVEPLSWKDQPVVQEDPEDPTDSGFRVDVELEGELGYLAAWLFEEADDNLELYLLQDRNGDGDFAWPDELVQRLTTPTSGGIFVPARSTPGAYQIWVHGRQVAGAGSRFRLDLVAVAGVDLALRDQPERLQAGRTASLELCAEPAADYDGPRVGLVEIDFGASGAIGRVPIVRMPGDPPAPRLYLPWLAGEQD